MGEQEENGNLNRFTDSKVQKYLLYLEVAKGCSFNTIKGYHHDLTSLLEYFKSEKIFASEKQVNWNEIQVVHLHSFLNYLYNVRKNKAASIHRRVCSLKSFFNFLTDNNLIQENPTVELSYPRRGKTLPKFLKTTEIEALLDKARKNAFKKTNSVLHSTVIEVMYSTGVRCNELKNMNLDDVTMAPFEFVDETGTRTIEYRGRIKIRNAGREREVILTHRACVVLRNYIRHERELTLQGAKARGKEIGEDNIKALFLSNRGKRIANRTVQHFVSKISQDAGLRHTTPHMIRHSFASHLVMNKTNIKAIQQLLGHASKDTTKIYQEIAPDYLKSELELNTTAN